MKKIIILSAFVFMFTPQAFAQDQVVTGNASAYTSVQTTNNNGSVESTIVVEANGVVRKVNSSSSGSIQVEVGNTANSNPQISVTQKIQTTITKSKNTTPKPRQVKQQKQFFNDFLSSLKHFFFPYWK